MEKTQYLTCGRFTLPTWVWVKQLGQPKVDHFVAIGRLTIVKEEV
jgi:hypothetical protein